MSEFYHSVRWDKEAQRVERERARIVALDPDAEESSEDEEESQDGADEGMTSTGGTGHLSHSVCSVFA